MNVADTLGQRIKALSIQCEPKGGHLGCYGTEDLGRSEAFVVDWEMEVDEISGVNLPMMEYSEFIRMASTPPRGGVKSCVPVLGNASGKVTLLCALKGDPDLNLWVRLAKDRPENFERELRERKLEYTRR